MDNFGFIHDKLDIKILILFILRRLPGSVDPETLLELCQCDDGIGYFDYSDCLSELVATGYIVEDEVESSLPYSVRSKALKLLAPVEERLRRAAMITARHETGENGCTVELAMGDGKGEVIRMRLLCADEEQARAMEKKFRKDAEGYYQRIMELFHP